MEQAVDSFLKTVQRSGLLPRDELQSIVSGLPDAQRDDPHGLANHLVRLGKLTRFQAEKLLTGRALGLILGPFRVLSPVGRGGMGTVYLARDQRSGLLVALKVLPPEKAREEERLLARFRREMELCQRVSHPHLARTFEVGEKHGVCYIAMEYIPGKSLYRLIAEQGPLPVPRAARLFAEVCTALEHAHGRGLIHRDLKPSNIMVTPNDHAKVVDLGLALIEGESGAEREVVGGQGYTVGSMDYIAPEQAEDASAVGPRSDIYALGCTLYYALIGRPPFPGGTALEKIQRHRREEPPRLTSLNPAVPRGFADLVRRMMAKDPQGRFASAAEAREGLLRWQSSDPALPLDRQDDPAFRRAVDELQLADVAAELVAEEIPVQPSDASSEEVDASEESRETLWLAGGLIGFWVVILAVLGLIWLFR